MFYKPWIPFLDIFIVCVETPEEAYKAHRKWLKTIWRLTSVVKLSIVQLIALLRDWVQWTLLLVPQVTLSVCEVLCV